MKLLRNPSGRPDGVIVGLTLLVFRELPGHKGLVLPPSCREGLIVPDPKNAAEQRLLRDVERTRRRD